MDAGLINISLAFVEGFALIISPCILPILPIILTGSLEGSKSRPLGIIVGFVVTFTLVTLFTRTLVQYAHVSSDVLRNLSYVVLIFLGVMMCSTYLTEKFNFFAQGLTNVGSKLKSGNNPQSGFFGGFIFGGLIGIIWTPCAGPILAAVIVQSIIQTTTISSILTVFSFALGAGLPMLLIAMAGRSVMGRFSFFREKTVLFRKILGLIIIASVIFFIYYSRITIAYANASVTNKSTTSLINGIDSPYLAPPIATDDVWINSPPLQLSQLKGKVVLIDFWTYSCINCIRTLPYLKDWYAKYKDNGLVIIGIHAPEFEFERNIDNVKAAIKTDEILYPVALDNEYHTWNNYKNQYWPAHYLIDKNGNVVYQHFGEGEYDVTENNIRYLLGLTGSAAKINSNDNVSSSFTPETYLGYARATSFSSREAVVKNKAAIYSYPDLLLQNSWALQGRWTVNADKIVANSFNSAIKIHFYAGNVYAVMGVTGQPVKITVNINGNKTTNQKVSDVIDSQLMVINHKLYTLISLKQADDGIVEIVATNPGLEIYTFTFGM